MPGQDLGSSRAAKDSPPFRRLVTIVTAFSFVLLAAFATFRATDVGADEQPGHQSTTTQEYSVALVSQVATQVPADTNESTESTESTTGSVADVAEEANPSVVTIYTFVDSSSVNGGFQPIAPINPNEGNQQTLPKGDNGDPTPLGAGSGWIYSADGYVVTNAHVVDGADSFVVQYYDGTQVEAGLVGVDTFQDVAVLKLNLDGDDVPGVARVGDSTAMRAGDEVVAIGSPLGEFTNSVSDGNIGGLNRSLDEGNGIELSNLIQHDAEISPGNSGGPLLNMKGEVIGMNVAKVETTSSNGASASGLNFAIDGNTVAGIVDRIINSNGSIEHPYLGVQTQETADGLVVMAVEPNGPAANAGIQEGDLLTGIDGDIVDQNHSFMQLLLAHEPGDTVTVNVDRNGSSEAVSVTLGVRPENV